MSGIQTARGPNLPEMQDLEFRNSGNSEIPLPRTSKNIANIVLGYEKGPLTLRAALTYRDEYLDEVDSEGFGDRYVLDHKQWDFSASYEIYDGVKLYGTMSNVNDRPFQAAFRTGGQDFLAQHEEYDWTASFGVKAKFQLKSHINKKRPGQMLRPFALYRAVVIYPCASG